MQVERCPQRSGVLGVLTGELAATVQFLDVMYTYAAGGVTGATWLAHVSGWLPCRLSCRCCVGPSWHRGRQCHETSVLVVRTKPCSHHYRNVPCACTV